MAYRALGTPQGSPWLVLHGGPGSGASAALWQAFDLDHHRIWVPDQRGSGASRPRGTLRGQHIDTLVADLERLRAAAHVPSWHVLGGSWGATLAMAYAAQHPHRVTSLVLRGTFTAGQRDVSRLLAVMTRGIQPPAQIPLNRVQPLLHRLSQLFRNGTPTPANTRWAERWQNAERQLALRGQWRAWLHSRGLPPIQRNALRRSWAQLQKTQRSARHQASAAAPTLLAKYRIQAHHLARHCRLRATDWQAALRVLAHHRLPVTWVHGSFDAVCSKEGGLRGHAFLTTHSSPTEWIGVHAGHLGTEPEMRKALRQTLARP